MKLTPQKTTYIILLIGIVVGIYYIVNILNRNEEERNYYHIETYANHYDTVFNVYKPKKHTVYMNFPSITREHIVDSTFSSLSLAEDYCKVKNLELDSIELAANSKEYKKID